MTPEARAFRGKAATLAFDTGMAFLSMFLAVFIAFALGNVAVPGAQMLAAALPLALLFAAFAAGVFVIMKVHHQVWRHMGAQDAIRVGQAALLTTLCFFPVLQLMSTFLVAPRSATFIVIVIWLGLLFGGRFFAITRSTADPTRLFDRVDETAPRVLVVGRRAEVGRVLRTAAASKVRALGILTLDEPESGRAIQGTPLIGGVEALADTLDLMKVRYGEVPWVALVGELRGEPAAEQILETAAERGAKLMAFSAANGQTPLRRLNTADLLGRPEHAFDPEPVAAMVAGARILVTGAGGSIGASLVRACVEFAPASITLFDQSEYNLYAIQIELSDKGVDCPVEAVIGSVRDRARLDEVLARARPDIVIHAAALKHVPLVEDNPCEAILTNVAGALETAEAACAACVKRFVFISSDKAASPSNVMGATKRLAERVLADHARRCPEMALSMVRFGNVLGSSGSVVPRFENQIANGGPVTVSHKDMTRYFMTIEEAARLVLAAATLKAEPGVASLFILDMGKPVSVLELAETMIRLSGRVPGRDIQIAFSGTRPGERLHEALTAPNETLIPTERPGIQRVSPPPDPVGAGPIEQLRSAANALDAAAVRRTLAVLVPGFAAPGRPDTP